MRLERSDWECGVVVELVFRLHETGSKLRISLMMEFAPIAVGVARESSVLEIGGWNGLVVAAAAASAFNQHCQFTTRIRYRRSAGQPRKDIFSDRLRWFRLIAEGNIGREILYGWASVVPIMSILKGPH